MDKSQADTRQALKKLEDQLTCAICLDAFKDPKLLQCFHVYCKDCLKKLVVQDKQGQISLRCPTCRKSTHLPQGSTMSDLQPAFHIHHLFDIQDAFEKVKVPQKIVCGKCTKETRSATSYCRDCGEFICATCADVHKQWDSFSNHEVVPLEDFEKKVKQLDALKRVTLYCSLHQGKQLELYCETCEELICHNCIVKKHRDHQYDLVTDTFQRQKGEIVASLEPIEGKLESINKILKQIDAQSKAAKAKRDVIDAEIQEKTREFQAMLELRKDELTGQLDETTQLTLKNLAAQRDEAETIQTQLISCLSFVKESLRTGSQGEVMKMKKGVVRQIKDITNSVDPEKISPYEAPNVSFLVSSEVAENCRQFGVVCSISAEKSYATGKGLEIATPGERVTAVVQICDVTGKVYPALATSLTCELSSDSSQDNAKGTVKAIEGGKYEIGYQTTNRGKHRLHIKVEGKHIKGSPFPVTVKLPVHKLGTPIHTIDGLNNPWGVAINQKGEVVVAEYGGNCISTFSSRGEKIHSFGSYGTGKGQLNAPYGVAIDSNGDILVTDAGNHRIQKFSAEGQYITAVGTHGNNHLQFQCPVGIKIQPLTNRIFIGDSSSHQVQILNPDLSYHGSIGGRGSEPGQMMSPWDVAFDSDNNVYVADTGNNRIQVFSENGVFLRQIGKKGAGKGDLNWPTMITINDENEIYIPEHNNHCISVFTVQGDHLTSFGSYGSGPGQFQNPRGIAYESGMVYVVDYANNRILVF